nr:hypothetical protein [Tanacetum cinerariifolium]
MAIQKDNHIDPDLKARWGFGGTEGKITVGPETVGETGGVGHARTRITEGGDGPALRIHQALSGIQSNMQSLADSRDDALAKSAELQKQVDDLQAQADKARQDEAEAKEIAELKAKLDAAKVTYRANASKESLQKQVDDLP